MIGRDFSSIYVAACGQPVDTRDQGIEHEKACHQCNSDTESNAPSPDITGDEDVVARMGKRMGEAAIDELRKLNAADLTGELVAAAKKVIEGLEAQRSIMPSEQITASLEYSIEELAAVLAKVPETTNPKG